MTSSKARTPSHLNSYVQSGPAGSASTDIASIGLIRAATWSILPFCWHKTCGSTHDRRGEGHHGWSEASRTGEAMRAIWKGAVSFGLVNIGVRMFAATEERDVSFHQVRRSDGSRIRYRRVAEADGEEVAYADIAKGYVLPSGETVVLTDDDFADLPLPSARVVVLETMVWPDEVREPAFGFLDEDVNVRPQERAMAESLVESMAGDFEPDQYTDEYREALQQVIDAKIEGREVVDTSPAKPDTGQVVDLMAALRASVDAAKRSRGEAAPAARPRAARKTAPAKAAAAPAKRPAAKKTAAK